MTKPKTLSPEESFRRKYEQINTDCFAPARQYAKDNRAKSAAVTEAKGLYLLLQLIGKTNWSNVDPEVKRLALQRVDEEAEMLATWSVPAAAITKKIAKALAKEDANFEWNLEELTGLEEILTKTCAILFGHTPEKKPAESDGAEVSPKDIGGAQVLHI